MDIKSRVLDILAEAEDHGHSEEYITEHLAIVVAAQVATNGPTHRAMLIATIDRCVEQATFGSVPIPGVVAEA